MSQKRWTREIESMVGPQGWYLARARKHLIWRNEAGDQVVCSSSPSDRARAMHKVKKEFRRYGCTF